MADVKVVFPKMVTLFQDIPSLSKAELAKYTFEVPLSTVPCEKVKVPGKYK